MSIAAVAWVLERSGLPVIDRAVLTVYAYHADEHGRDAWPSLETVARESGAARSTVQEARKRLEASGALEQTGTRPGGGRVYRLPMRNALPAPGPLPAPGTPDAGDPTGSRTPAIPAPGPEPSFEPSESLFPPVDPPAELRQVAALNGSTPAVVQRFVELRSKRPRLRVDVPRVIQALEDHSHVPDLKQHALDCADWLGSEAPKAKAKKDAASTLRTWLRREAQHLTTRGAARPNGGKSYNHAKN